VTVGPITAVAIVALLGPTVADLATGIVCACHNLR
jgi:hypothetical protein